MKRIFLVVFMLTVSIGVSAQNATDDFVANKDEYVIRGESDAEDCIQRHVEAIALAIDKYARLYNFTDFRFNYEVIDVVQEGVREIVTLRIGRGTDVRCTRSESSINDGTATLQVVELLIKSAKTSLVYQYQEDKKPSSSKTARALVCETGFNIEDEK